MDSKFNKSFVQCCSFSKWASKFFQGFLKKESWYKEFHFLNEIIYNMVCLNLLWMNAIFNYTKAISKRKSKLIEFKVEISNMSPITEYEMNYSNLKCVFGL